MQGYAKHELPANTPIPVSIGQLNLLQYLFITFYTSYIIVISPYTCNIIGKPLLTKICLTVPTILTTITSSGVDITDIPKVSDTDFSITLQVLHHYITSSLHHYFTISLHHYITISLHHFMTTSIHYFITSPSPCRPTS